MSSKETELFMDAERLKIEIEPMGIGEIDLGPRDPDYLTECFMSETNGGGAWEDVDQLDMLRAGNVGLPDFTGNSSKAPISLENTIGADNRVPIPDTTRIPWRSICRLQIRYQDGRTALGTAWFVGPAALATAAHNLFHPRAGAAAQIWALPAYDGVIRYNAPAIEELVYPREWNPTDRRRRRFRPEHDFGVILLRDPGLGYQLGWFGTAGYNSPPARLAAQICGYSEDTGRPTQYYNGGRISRWSDSFAEYTFDTERGMSGSPVFTKIGNRRYVVAIHSYGTPTMNRGRRISGQAFTMLREASQYRA